VVVVHGLNGDFKKTWADGQEPPWISTALSKAVPKARIMSFDYNATTDSETRIVGPEGLRRVAYELLSQIRGLRLYPNNVPIIFIGHCLGGVLIQEVCISNFHHIRGILAY
ncbi:hypothetical protein L873DRAFT_1713186, partial [Choiromyces venosus 120613-1]